MKKNVAFIFVSLSLYWNEMILYQFNYHELPVQMPVQLLLELELNWLVQNVIELEFEHSRM